MTGHREQAMRRNSKSGGEIDMRTNLRHIVAVGIAFLCCFVLALPYNTASAGVNRWTPIGPDGANVAALAIDPRAPATAYAGTLGSGVLKTVDGGITWVPANTGLPTINVYALAIDPVSERCGPPLLRDGGQH